MNSDSDQVERSASTFLRGLAVQGNVVGALIMRELHTRYGRENVGYLWMILEPMTLALAVASLHAGQKDHLSSDILPVPFAVIGYCVFIIFRGIFNRADGALESNLPLLYHRMVTIFDILLSRALLEGAGVGATLFIILGFCAALGLGDLPVRPLALMSGIILMLWFAFSLSMIVCALTHVSRVAERMVHPTTYILMPISGAFYQLSWLPEPYRSWMSWFPMTQIFELVRYGQFESANDRYVMPLYIIGWCLVLTYIGLISIRVIRRRVHLR